MFTNTSHTTKRMTALLVFMLAIGTLLAPGGYAQPVQYTVKIDNNSSFTIYRIQLSSIYDNSWPDLLGDDVLVSYYRFTTRLRPGLYDLKLVDEDGDVCVVPGVAVRGNTYMVHHQCMASQLRVRSAITAHRLSIYSGFFKAADGTWPVHLLHRFVV